MDSWNQIPNGTKVYLVVLFGLIVLFGGLILIRTDVFSMHFPSVHDAVNTLAGRFSFGRSSIPTPGEGAPSAVAIQDAKIYRSPDTNSGTLGVLKKDRLAQLVGISADSQWWVIKISPGEKGQGWVQAEQVKTANSVGIPAIGPQGEALALATPTPAGPYLVALANTQILAGPGADFGNLGILEGGQRAGVLGTSQDGAWWVIQVPYATNGQGWVAADRVRVTNGSAVPVVTPVASSSSESDVARVRALQNLNVRSGPGMNYPKVGTLQKDQNAQIIGVDPEGFWWQIKIPGSGGGGGWISKDYGVAQNASNVPVIQQGVSGGSSAIPSPAPGTPMLTANVMINIRAGPGKQYQTIGQLKQGQTAAVVGISPDGIWWVIKVAVGDITQGWVAAAYVTPKNAERVPVIH